MRTIHALINRYIGKLREYGFPLILMLLASIINGACNIGNPSDSARERCIHGDGITDYGLQNLLLFCGLALSQKLSPPSLTAEEIKNGYTIEEQNIYLENSFIVTCSAYYIALGNCYQRSDAQFSSSSL